MQCAAVQHTPFCHVTHERLTPKSLDADLAGEQQKEQDERK